jgi:hypothetical protein
MKPTCRRGFTPNKEFGDIPLAKLPLHQLHYSPVFAAKQTSNAARAIAAASEKSQAGKAWC